VTSVMHDDMLAAIGALHLSGYAVVNPTRNAAGDVMFDIVLEGENRG